MRRKLKGYFMLFRILPVLVWSFTGTLVGTALAVMDIHEIKWMPFLLVLMTCSLVQGYPTHIINEVFDWRSGADGRDLGEKKSGGSKVLQAGLLEIKDLWLVFVVSHLVLGILVIACALVINSKIVYYFILPGYLSGLFYSLPPFRFSYRPFLGEWLGGFAGIFLLVLGSYFAQTSAISPYSILIAGALGLIYIAIMTFFHYLDFENDQLATPVKNTTVVYLGLEGSRRYAYFCLLLSAIVFLVGLFNFQFQQIPLWLLSMVVFFSHKRIDLRDELSIIKWGKVITYAAILAGLSFAALAKPILSLMVLPAAISFWAHKRFGKLRGLSLPTSS